MDAVKNSAHTQGRAVHLRWPTQSRNASGSTQRLQSTLVKLGCFRQARLTYSTRRVLLSQLRRIAYHLLIQKAAYVPTF